MRYINPRQNAGEQTVLEIVNEDFTHKAYGRFWQMVLDRGFSPVSFTTGIANPNSKEILLQQFIQYSPEATAALVKIQNEVGTQNGVSIPSLIVLRTDSESFAWNSEESINVLKGIFAHASPVELGLQFDVNTNGLENAPAQLTKTAQEVQDHLGITPTAFSLVNGAAHQSYPADQISGMINLQSPKYRYDKEKFVLYSDALGGRHGSPKSGLDKAEKSNLPLIMSNLEGAWWSPSPLSPMERLERIGKDLPGRFPAKYVRDVKEGGLFIPGEPGSLAP